jgi:hypothetical protein
MPNWAVFQKNGRRRDTLFLPTHPCRQVAAAKEEAIFLRLYVLYNKLQPCRKKEKGEKGMREKKPFTTDDYLHRQACTYCSHDDWPKITLTYSPFLHALHCITRTSEIPKSSLPLGKKGQVKSKKTCRLKRKTAT